MEKRATLAVLAAIFALLMETAGGCATDGKGAPLDLFLGDGKSDISERVQDRGALSFDAPREGDFVEDFEMHGYRISVRGGAAVTLDNTHAGSSSKLDSIMHVFGPWNGTGFGTDSIAFDDDSGWGSLARVTFEPEQGGEYLVVLTTFDGTDRGRYRLEARCESTDCSLVELPLLASSCHPDILAGVQACVDDVLANVDPAEMPPSEGDAVVRCTDAEPLAPLRDAVCATDPTVDFCGLDYEHFVSYMAPVCMGDVALARHVAVLPLSEEEPSPELNDEASDGCGPDCDLTVSVYSYPPFLVGTLPATVASVWSGDMEDFPVDETTASTTGVQVDPAVADLVEAVIEMVHGPHEIGLLEVNTETGSHLAYVISIPSEHRIVVIEVDRQST